MTKPTKDLNDAIAEAEIVAAYFRNLMINGVDAAAACQLTSSFIFARRTEAVQMAQFNAIQRADKPWENPS